MSEKMYIKGFDEDLKCRGGFQFEVGKEYKIELPEEYKLTADDLCSDKVFHFCDSLEKVHMFYGCHNENNRFCIVEPLGDVVESDGKCGSNHIKIVREIVGEELKALKGLINENSGLFNSGSRNSGWHNSGWHNSGSRNSGSYNSGCHNSGSYNSGWHNSGSYNSGLFNSCDCSNGVFCNVEPKICIFNIQTDMTMAEFKSSEYYYAIHSSQFELTKWENDKLVNVPYKDACKSWWNNMTDENKEIIKSMPNFDVDIFCDITGINIVDKECDKNAKKCFD